MKRTVGTLLLAFLLAIFCRGTAHGQNEASGGCIPVRTTKVDSLAFGSGEKMKFTMHYEWGAINSDVAWAAVELDSVLFNGIPCFKCKAYGQTSLWYDKLFRVRERFTSIFTMDGLVPMYFKRDTEEGKYVARNTYNYIRGEGEGAYISADVYSSSRGQRQLDLPLTPCTYDLPALCFLARNMDFDRVEPGVKYPMTFAIDDEVYNVHFILIGREVRKVKGLGKVRTIKFAARLIAGEIFKGDQDMMIWVSDDDNRIPVYFEAPILWGVASGRLAGFAGLKHPFSALIKHK